MAKKYQSLPLTEDEIENKFSCGICTNILDNPYRPNVCSHVFCKNCLINSFHQSVSKSCPICRTSFDINKIAYAKKIDDEIYSTTYCCSTCNQNVLICKLNQHNFTCKQRNQGARSGKMQSTLNSTSKQFDNSKRPPVINRHTFKCPYCDERNLTTDALRGHCNEYHVREDKNKVCPICAVMPWGDPNLQSIDFLGHLNLRHVFQYDNYVEYDKNDDEMLEIAVKNSLRIY